MATRTGIGPEDPGGISILNPCALGTSVALSNKGGDLQTQMA